MQDIFFTSDWHLFHKNIIKYSHRPFKNIEVMNDSILKMFYSTVKNGDIVYFLGDFAFSSRSRENQIVSILEEITEFVEFHFILGNHDHNLKQIYENHCTSVSNLKEIKIEGQNITLCHYPMHTFNHSHYNSWQLYGHHHWNTNSEFLGKRFNVSVDANNFHMISFKKMRRIMEQRNNNWDYRDPSIRETERKIQTLERKIEKLEGKINDSKKKLESSDVEKIPKSVVNNELIRIKTLKDQKEELLINIKKFKDSLQK